MVLIDEESKLMYIDSLQRENLIEDEELPDVDQLLDQHFGAGKTEYVGEETVHGARHLKIRSELEKVNNSYTLYWVNAKTGKLSLMAEFMDGSYTVYQVKTTGKSPKDYDFTINIPNNEISDFYGYEVIDMRFANDMLNATINENYNN